MKNMIPVAVAISLVGSGVYAAIPSAGGTIRGCHDQQGNLRVIDEVADCDLGETLLQWGSGAQGPAGPPGPAGSGSVSVMALLDYDPPFSKLEYRNNHYTLDFTAMMIPPGKYTVTGRVDTHDVNPGYIACGLRVIDPNQAIQVVDDLFVQNAGSFETVNHTLLGVIQNTSAVNWKLELACQSSEQFVLQDISIVVTKADQLTVVGNPR